MSDKKQVNKKPDEPVKEKEAEEIFKEFREVSVTEFFRKNKAHLGYSGKVRSLTTVVHELITNSLDACEESGILPEISVKIKQVGKEHYRFTSTDNGPGIPESHINDVFGKMLAGTKFHRSVQLRGQQGIGVTGVTLFSQMTTGKPMKILTSTGNGKIHEVHLLVDVVKNKADVIETKIITGKWRGTEIEGELKGVLFNLGEYGPYEYIRRTAIANPHLSITFMDPEGRKSVFQRSSKLVPKPPVETKPHPKGMDTDELLQMAKKSISRHVSSFLESDFTRISKSKVGEIQAKVNFDLKKNPRKLTWAEAEEIAAAFEQVDFMAPPVGGLRPIGEKQIHSAVTSILKPEFESIVTRNPTTYSGGIPFQVEVAVAYGGNAGRSSGEGKKSEVMRFANSAPLLFDYGGCGISEAVSSVDWKRYDIRDFDNAPITVFVNLVSVYVPYTSAGKQSVSSNPDVVKEIRMALMEVARKFQRYHSKKRREFEKEARLHSLMKYSTELAAAIARMTGKDEGKILKDLQNLIKYRLKIEGIEEAAEEEEEVETTFDDKEGDVE
ncbi:MAG: DNA topoisomerase VI subunit B [Candidatus Altiarchaeota archaeon]